MRHALLFAITGCATMQPSPETKGMVPDLEYFVGRWHAEAKNPTNGKTFTLEYTVQPALHGRWYIGTGHAPALDLEIHDLWGKDPVTGEIVRTIFDSAQTFGTVRSSGWRGDVLVLQGEAATTQGRVTVRETITRKSGDEFHAVWEARDGETWSAYSIETLRRQR
jgi:hypothetical protein